jgi:O-antigen ligase
MKVGAVLAESKSKSIHLVVVVLIGVILAVVPFYATQYVFAGLIFEKAMLFYGLMTVLILLYLCLVFLDRQYLPKFNLVGWGFLALTIGWIVSTIASSQPYSSFWGSFNRMEGMISWLYYFAFFVVATGALKKPADWWMVIKITIAGITLVVLYALAQLFNISLFAKSMNRWRVESSLGNPVFLGGYLASALPLILVWVFNLKSRRWIAWILMGAAVVVLIFTLSRGAWIAGAIAVPLTLTFYFYRYRPAWVKRVLIFLGVGLVIFVVLTTGWLLAPKDSLFRTVGENAIFRSESMLYRQNNWAIGWQSFIQKPLTGWGLENFHVAYDRNYRVFDRHVNFQESHVDRAHNEYIGVAVAGGLLALIPYLWLLFYAIYCGWKNVKKQRRESDDYLLNLGMLGALVGYAVFVFTAFNLITNILFFILALAWMNRSVDHTKFRSSWWQKPVLGLLAVVTLVFAYFTVVSPIWAVKLADRGTVELRNGSYGESLTLFKSALAKKSFMTNTIRSQMSVLASSGGTQNVGDNKQLIEFQEYTGSILKDIFKTEPYTSYTGMIMGIFYGNLASKFPEYVSIADQVFSRTAAMAPNKGETWLRWGEMYAQVNDWPKAKAKFDEAMNLDPHNYDIQFISGTWYIWFGEIERGNELVRQAIQAGHTAKFADVKSIADAFEHAGKIDKVETLYLQIIDDPQNEQETVFAIVDLIDVYRRAGRWDDARKLANKLLQYDVEPTQRDQLIQDIENHVTP